MACRSMGGGEPSLEGLGQERKGQKLYMQHELQRTRSEMRGSRLSPSASPALFQTPQEAAIRTAFLGQLSIHRGTKFS